MTTLTRAALAHHEAGHAVAYLIHDWPFRYITLRPRARGVAGRVTIHRPRPIDRCVSAVITMAGPVCELAHMLMAADAGEWGGPDDPLDYGVPIVYAALENDGRCDEIHVATDLIHSDVADLAEVTASIMLLRWRQVAALADALIASPRAITYAQARQITEAAS
jgi:hypothetical protein